MSLFPQAQVPFHRVKQGEVFFTPDDGEQYVMTKRGAKSCDGYGDIVGLDDTEVVTLTYTDTVDRRRVALTVELVERMAASGHIFFSAVVTKIDPYKNLHYHVEASDAWQDTMFFHVPGHALIIIASLHYRNTTLLGESMFWKFRLIGKGAPYDAQVDMAKRLGIPTVTLPWHPNFIGEHKEAQIPFYRSTVKIDDFSDVGNHTWHEGRNRCVDLLFEQYDDRQVLDGVACADRIIPAVAKMVPFTNSGPFAEMHVGTFAPTFAFPNCDHDFWIKFNTSYLRKLVRRPLGIPSTVAAIG